MGSHVEKENPNVTSWYVINFEVILVILEYKKNNVLNFKLQINLKNWEQLTFLFKPPQ